MKKCCINYEHCSGNEQIIVQVDTLKGETRSSRGRHLLDEEAHDLVVGLQKRIVL